MRKLSFSKRSAESLMESQKRKLRGWLSGISTDDAADFDEKTRRWKGKEKLGRSLCGLGRKVCEMGVAEYRSWQCNYHERSPDGYGWTVKA
jgi:hypothetical protein